MTRRLVVVLMICCGILIAGNALAAFYTWVDEQGVTHISDAPVEQGGQNAKVEKRPGGNDEYRWFGCPGLDLEESSAAAEFLRSQGWSAKPDYRPNARRFGDAFQSVRIFEVRLPEEAIKGTRCSSGYQEVRVKSVKNPKDRNRCRIASVELGNQRFQPSSCMKEKKNR